MKDVNYSFAVGNLMYIQIYIQLDIIYDIGVLGKYISDYGPMHFQETNKVFRYLQSTKDHMVTYLCINSLDVVRLCNVD